MFVFKKLEVWHKAKDIAVKVYELTKEFPSDEKYGLCSQLNRAAVSIASNIAEGSSRSSFKEQVHFSEIAYGSLMEVTCQLEIANELGFIDTEKYNTLIKLMEDLAVRLSNYKKSQLKRIPIKSSN